MDNKNIQEIRKSNRVILLQTREKANKLRTVLYQY
jgi:hypothetical protein